MQTAGVIFRICHHREVPCHIDASDEDGFDIVAMLFIASEVYPGIVMALRVFFEGGFAFNIFLTSLVLGDKDRSLFSGELK